MTAIPTYRPYLAAWSSPKVGDRVVCKVNPDTDGSMPAGEVTEVLRQSNTDSLVRVLWDDMPGDNDLYPETYLEREGWVAE
jgi:hypothetical protein